MTQVLHIAEWLSRERGGVAPVVFNLARAQRQLGLNASVGGLADEHFAGDEAGWKEHVPVLARHCRGPQSFGYVPAYARQMSQFCGQAEVVHSHGLWMYPNMVASRWASARGVPVVISLHGLLEPWARSWSGWKKRLASILYADRNMRSATCVHALCAKEMENLRSYGVRNPIAVIPNGVSLTQYSALPTREQLSHKFPEISGKKIILFLGRIHPKKGLLHLVEAWAGLAHGFSDWHLVIAGPDVDGHTNDVSAQVGGMGVAHRVSLTGKLGGADKLAAFAAADIFVLPSFSEGFSLAVLEAMACRLPVLLTPQCNFPEAKAAGAVVEVHPNVQSTQDGLRELLEMTDQERRDIGQCAHELISTNYTWEAIARAMVEVYGWCLGGGNPPPMVQFQ